MKTRTLDPRIDQAMILVLPNRLESFGVKIEPAIAPIAGVANKTPTSAIGAARVSVRKSTIVELDAAKKNPIEEVNTTRRNSVLSS